MTRQMMHRAARAFLTVMYPASVFAAQVSLGDQLKSYDLATMGAVALLICVGGFTGLLQRLKKEYHETDELLHPKTFIASTMFGAIAAGIVAMFLGEPLGLSGALHAVFIIIASYGGTVFLETVFDWLVERFMPSSKSRINIDDDYPKTAPQRPLNAAQRALLARKNRNPPPTDDEPCDDQQPKP